MSKSKLFKMILAVSEVDRDFAIFYLQSAIKQAEACQDCDSQDYFIELLALVEGN